MLSYEMLSGRITTDPELINVNAKAINRIVENILFLIKGADVS